MLISSPPRAPCSCIQYFPLAGLIAAPCALRWPKLQISGRAPDKRIIRRHRSVGTDADDLAKVIAEVLRLVAKSEVIAGREEQSAVRHLHDAPAPMIAARKRPLLTEDHRQVFKPRLRLGHEARASHTGAAAALGRLGVAEIDGAIAGELAIEHNIQQSALAGREDFWH